MPKRDAKRPAKQPNPLKAQLRAGEDIAAQSRAPAVVDDDGPVEEGQEFTVIDGALLEGGGQVLRNSAALSAILQKPVYFKSIRARRDKPGLKAQHARGLSLIGELHPGTLRGSWVGSSTASLRPGPFVGGDRDVEIGTAGAVTLLIQISLPTLLFGSSPILLSLGGGTNASMAPPIDYMEHVFRPAALRFGCDFTVKTVRRGFFPRGGGKVELHVNPCQRLTAASFADRGSLIRITSRAYCAGRVPRNVPARINAVVRETLLKFLHATGISADTVQLDLQDIVEPPERAVADGCGVLLTAHTSTGLVIAGSCLGERGKPAEQVAEEACNELLSVLSCPTACVDEYLQDQLIILMALAEGKSDMRCGPLSMHTQTSIYFTQLMTGATFEVTPADPDAAEHLVSVTGIGFRNRYLSDSALPAAAAAAAK